MKKLAEAGVNSMVATWVAEADSQARVWRRRSLLLVRDGRRHLASNAEMAAQWLSNLARNYRAGA